MDDGAELPGEERVLSDKDRKRAAKAQAKQQKRADKEAARAQREAELARLESETAGRLAGFRVFTDGTIQKDNASSNPLIESAVSAWRDKLSQAGIVTDSDPSTRSAVVESTLIDKRIRKPFARARSAVHIGLISSGKDHFGNVTLTITTRNWTETLTANGEEDVAALIALNDVIQEVQGVPPEGSSDEEPERELPPPQTQGEVAEALRELKGLHDEGLLTDDEFEVRRRALVAHLHGGR